jgi:hypothetical protein
MRSSSAAKICGSLYQRVGSADPAPRSSRSARATPASIAKAVSFMAPIVRR